MPESPATQASLLVRLGDAGDSAAWNRFVDLYAPLIYGFFRKRGAQDADAADLTQTVLARVSQGIRKFDYDPKHGTFRGWLFTVVRNCWRSWASRPQLAQQPAMLDELSEEEDAAWRNDYRRCLFDWAANQVRPTVTPPTWQAFWRTSIDGCSAAEVANELGMSVAAVYMARSRVLARLKEVLLEADGVGIDL